MKAVYYSLTDKGVTRDHNEDYFLNSSLYALFMVADGMGGYQCGDYASRLGLDSIISYLDTCTDKSGVFSERSFIYAIEYANRCIFNYKTKNAQIKNMGTTFISFMIADNNFAAFHIGDSRLYRLRENRLVQLTKDHSAEKEVLPDFMQNANQGKYSSVLTRALGTNESVAADMTESDFRDGDIFLLCSDGLYSMLPDHEISLILNTNDSTKKKCENLITKANQNGGEDNITATVIQIENSLQPDKFEMIQSE